MHKDQLTKHFATARLFILCLLGSLSHLQAAHDSNTNNNKENQALTKRYYASGRRIVDEQVCSKISCGIDSILDNLSKKRTEDKEKHKAYSLDLSNNFLHMEGAGKVLDWILKEGEGIEMCDLRDNEIFSPKYHKQENDAFEEKMRHVLAKKITINIIGNPIAKDGKWIYEFKKHWQQKDRQHVDAYMPYLIYDIASEITSDAEESV